MADPTRPFDTIFDEIPFGLLLSQPDEASPSNPMADWRKYDYDRAINALAHTVGMGPVRQPKRPYSMLGGRPLNPIDWPTNLSLLLEATPVAAARDLVQSVNDIERASKANDSAGVLSAGASGLLAAMGLAPGGRLAKVVEPLGSSAAPHLRAGIEALTKVNPRGLPMDLANQRTRALEQLFGLAPPQRLYHASYATYPGFDPKKTIEGAVTLTNRPPMADSYIGRYPVLAHLADPGAQRSFRDPSLARVYFEEQVYPIVLRNWDRFPTFDRGGQAYDRSMVRDALSDARSKRAPGVVFENMRDPGPAANHFDLPEAQLPGTVVYLLKTNYARSPFAVFDPLRMRSRNLGAALLPAASLGMLAPYLPTAEEQP